MGIAHIWVGFTIDGSGSFSEFRKALLGLKQGKLKPSKHDQPAEIYDNLYDHYSFVRELSLDEESSLRILAFS